ncbi:glutamine-hydrolyzing GMP synthase [Treponema sp. HNW]|uniref:glutamine-hydrolyzing GMP synthase n=1 Tax=Treponema sp. HNW TaxID=3116654 RepID=UPI003D0E7F69
MRKHIKVLDFGSQYAHLITKRLRLSGYYAEIASPASAVNSFEHTCGIILSGGPASVYEKEVPEFNEAIFGLDIPILGLCYGHQLMCKHYGGTVEKAETGEFGIASLLERKESPSPLFENIAFPSRVWMSHQDEVSVLPPGFECSAYTANCTYAAVQDLKRKRFGLQFHTEVKDTLQGIEILENFARFCGMEKNRNTDVLLNEIIEDIRREAKNRSVLLFLSGGVDSTVAFALLNKALGTERVKGLHIDNGFMRKNESASIAERYRSFGFTNFIVEDASERFLKAVYRETDPQKKRHAVGETFIKVRDEVAAKYGLDSDHWLLAQGTLYPDIIESGGTKNAHVIKTHHNRVEGIQELIEKGLIIEPLKDLYKDEVRIIGKRLGLPDELIMRHPFPGPGLSINVLGSTGKLDNPSEYKEALSETVAALGELKKRLTSASPSAAIASPASQAVADAFTGDLAEAVGCIERIGVLPVKSVGVQGDFRTYRFPAVLYTANQDDYADKKASLQKAEKLFAVHGAERLWGGFEHISSGLTNSCKNINRTIWALYEKKDCRLIEGYCDKGRLDHIREADAVMLDELRKSSWYAKIFQHLTINLPYAAEDGHCSIVLRPVVSEDVMTARFAHLEPGVLFAALERITDFDFIDAVYYDITNKPPATFGWE